MAAALLASMGAQVAAAAPAVTADGYAIPQPGHHFSFPADYGAHPNFRIEWWYLTGHLYAADARRFGFQATFFRFAGPKDAAPTPADFSRNALFLAHMAVTDVNGGRFHHTERLNRQGWDAHAAVGRLDLRNGPWTLTTSAPPHAPGRIGSGIILKLSGSVEADASFALTLEPTKPLVVFGEDGVSRKGSEPSAASYYLTFPRLRTTGTLTVGESQYQVHGEAWMDHEISSSQLGANQIGWDWTCVQFRDSPWELMLYRLRRADGTADPASRLQWVDPRSQAITSDYGWRVLSWWKSPRSGARYPSRVELSTTSPATGRRVHLLLEPLAKDQELTNALGGGPYWEGTCRVRDEDTGKDIGSAYMELTGYAKALKM
ncbi:MAG TPA: carotenoid 1,2-hydratase [Opitutaceae bacterium]|jgi:predicted secreted hydrolase|nr:carotenoid 1,2-hydratase [Opitutaceae bacterium]